jgi:dipeptidyl aminopeptidase/acylaminoacyl peptidase
MRGDFAMQTRTRFPLEELVRLPDFYLPMVSPDGSRVAYYGDFSGRMELWVLDLASGATRQVSKGQVPKSPHAGFVWDPTGTAIVFPHDEGGNEQHDLWLLDLETGEATQLTATPHAQEIPMEFSPDGQWLSFVSTRDGQLNLYKLRRDGSEVTQLTRFDNPVEIGGQWSPDGTHLIAAANELSDPHNLDVYIVPADGSGPRQAFSSGEGTFDIPTDWSPDGRFIALTSDAGGSEQAGVLEVEAGTVRWLSDGSVEESSRTFSRDGRHLLVIRNRDAVLRPVLYEMESGVGLEPALPMAGSITAGDFALDGSSLVLSYSSDAERSTLVLYDLASAEVRTLLAPQYGSIDRSLFVSAEDVYYPSFDGLRIHALLYRPHDLDENERIPAVVMPHGGPTWQYFHDFDPYVQFLVNEGYAVLAPNIRGSTGYGVEFRDMARHDWGGADLQDIVAGRQYLASRSFIDPERIAVFGGSYGGFMTYIAVTKAPDAWKAGVAWVGISDLPAMYKESMPHYKFFLQEQMGDPEANAELWADRSAANFADRMQARLLIVHGVNDPRCPISQARIFRDRLLAANRQEGRDFEYVELSDEGHGSADQEQRLRAFRLLADFLQRAL